MKHRWNPLRALPGLLLMGIVHAQGVPTAFTYQGLLEDAAPQGTVYDFRATVFDTACEVAPCTGIELAAPQAVTGVATQAGRFTLELDFGAIFHLSTAYLELQVRRSGEPAYTPLLPRQRLTSTPYAQHARVADFALSSGSITAPVVIQNPSAPDVRLGFDAEGNLLANGTWDDANPPTLPVSGGGTRMMWIPKRAALRAGYLVASDDPVSDLDPSIVQPTQWDEANIGYGSIAVGTNVRASASNSTAFGLWTTAAQQSSFAVGEGNVASGAASMAMGYHAHTNARQGSFVFADRSTVDYLRAGVNHSANWRVSGGFRIFTASNLSTGVTLQSGASVSNWGQSSAVISTSTGAMLTTGGVWQNASDVARKHYFEAVDGEDILARLSALPISSWSYKTEDDRVRHLGPTSQDFMAAFGLGHDDKSIGTVDADGVALAAAQALEARSARQQRELEALREENAMLRVSFEELSKRLSRLEAHDAAGRQ